MKPNALGTQALLSLYESLQGDSREEFAREILKRSSFFCEVKFEAPRVDVADDIEVAFVITAGPQRSTFKFPAEDIDLARIELLLTGDNARVVIDEENGIVYIDVKNGYVKFSVSRFVGDLECIVPYASCAAAFRQFHSWKSEFVVPAQISAVDVVSSEFNIEGLVGILSVTWNIGVDGIQSLITGKWKVQLEQLRETSMTQWEQLLNGDEVEITIKASQTFGGMRRVMQGPNEGQMIPWDNWSDHIIRLKSDPFDPDFDDFDEEDKAQYLATRDQEKSIEFITGFYLQNGVVNGGNGFAFDFISMKPAIQNIVAYLEIVELGL